MTRRVVTISLAKQTYKAEAILISHEPHIYGEVDYVAKLLCKNYRHPSLRWEMYFSYTFFLLLPAYFRCSG